jgi:hypothetical protein
MERYCLLFIFLLFLALSVSVSPSLCLSLSVCVCVCVCVSVSVSVSVSISVSVINKGFVFRTCLTQLTHELPVSELSYLSVGNSTLSNPLFAQRTWYGFNQDWTLKAYILPLFCSKDPGSELLVETFPFIQGAASLIYPC